MLDFHDRVAVITGAGRGIGRAYAHLLAERGAAVVVNDAGGSVSGHGSDRAPAAQVVDEIRAAGGRAIASFDDVTRPESAASIIDAAVGEFGRIDILVTNAGILSEDRIPDVSLSDLQRNLDVHLIGAFNVAMAAWPLMVDAGYGRIVMTTSSGVFGLPSLLCYGTGKAGVIGLARGLAVAAAEHGIRVNMISPNAYTRMSQADPDDVNAPPEEERGRQSPERVAPTLAYLAHEECPVNGEILLAGMGRVARIFIGETYGWAAPAGDHTVEDVADHWQQIMSDEAFFVPTGLDDWYDNHVVRALGGR